MRNLKLILVLLSITALSHAQNWNLNFDSAKSISLKEQKPLFLVFSGSDWCAPCIKLEAQIWKSSEFIEYSAKNFVLVKADFPRKKSNSFTKEQLAHNEKLAEKYNQKGYFPLVVIFDVKGKVIGETGYKNISPKEYIQHLESFIK